MKKQLLYIILLLLSVVPCPAQTDVSIRQIYTQAENDYTIGRIEQARDSLLSHLDAFRGQQRQNALRLIALTYLARFDTDQTELYASMLLQENPYYTPSARDPETFIDIIDKVKSGATVTVTTASSIKETAVEAPAPVIIITADMIENLGYNKHLGQILATYVPGMSEVFMNTTRNMSMHGAYGTTQELILVMENGHRLNSRFNNSYAMDYDISTDKIDHIEVLRGPASSLYGDVALSAVVNIITKSGGELDGVRLKYGHGAFSTHKADVSIGTRFMGADIFVWGGFYQSDGQHRPARDAAEYEEKFNVPMPNDYYAYVDGYRDTPTYDLGMTLQYKGIELLIATKNIKKLSQYGVYGYYDYDKYRSINGIRPGWLTQTSYVQLSYTRQMGPATLKGSVYGDWHNTEEFMTFTSENADTTNSWVPKGEYTYIKWTDRTLGGSIQAGADYKTGSMKGNLLAGVQFQHFSLTDHNSGYGQGYTGMMQPGIDYDYFNKLEHENSWSFYAQCKHYFMPELIINAGLRYDLRSRFRLNTAKNLSPRLALI
ncbi:MAG: TonB-dependent receptor plug domain-containing protein, partial [Prevotella sp.]|nr:TonB-dependent receptor plug domain-containing protein [Prevotella sp.]